MSVIFPVRHWAEGGRGSISDKPRITTSSDKYGKYCTLNNCNTRKTVSSI
jgi:hypothetical protein